MFIILTSLVALIICNPLDEFAHPDDPIPITPDNIPLGITPLSLNLTAQDTSTVDENPQVPKSFWRDPFSTTNATFCWKQSHLRSLSFKRPCKSTTTTLKTKFGVCMNQCPSSQITMGPVCWSRCPTAFPAPCGLGCATSEATCRSDKLNKITSVAILAFNLGAAAHLATGLGHSITKLSLHHTDLLGKGLGVKEAAERALAASISHFLKNKMGPVAAAKMAQTLATDAFEDKGSVDWTVRGFN